MKIKSPDEKQQRRRESNRRGQAAYRKRNGEALRRARRVAYALVRFRYPELTDPESALEQVADALREFLTPEEIGQLLKTIEPIPEYWVAEEHA